MTERPYATWELILMAAVLVGWAAIGIRVMAAALRQRRRDREATRLSQTNRRSIAMATKKQQERPVIVTTEHRGVFFGYATDTSGDRFQLKRARMAIYWGTTRGLMELVETGPTKASKISARADLDVRKVTAVFEVTPEAAAKWEAA